MILGDGDDDDVLVIDIDEYTSRELDDILYI
jgi:hypothetical protein